MSKIKHFLSSIQPFSRRDNSRFEYVIQKLLAFAVIFAVSAVLVEAVIILGFLALGYDVLSGDLPDHPVVWMLPLFGYAVFALLTFLYVKRIEKRPLPDMLFRADRKSFLLFAAFLLAGILWVSALMGGFLLSGVYTFAGYGAFSGTTVAWLLAFIIQGSGEELLCRGFLQNSLMRRVSRPVAITFSALCFTLPHASGLTEMSALPMLISLLNLILVSLLFSFLMIRTRSVLSVCGLHAGWNFALGTLFGVNVSGMDTAGGVFRLTASSAPDLLTGGNYGIEASILLTPVLFAALFCYFSIGRGEKNDVR